MPRPRDLRRLLDAVEAVTAAGKEWPATVLDHLCAFLPASVGILGVSRNFAPGEQAESVLTIRRGWASAEHERIWLAYADTPVMRTPEYKALVSFEGRQITRLRDQIWPRESWYKSRTYTEVHEPAGLDDSVISICRQDDGPYSLSIWMHRAPGDAPFTRREWWLLHVLTGHLALMVGHALSLPDPLIDSLTPRQRQTLDRLLAGDSEKEAAAALGIQRSTLHEHVLGLYRHFGVTSRSELMARFINRPPDA